MSRDSTLPDGLMQHRRPFARTGPAGVLAAACLALIGCEQPERAPQFPQGTLQVRYEGANRYSGCLTACVAMAANYLLDKHVLDETIIRREMELAGLAETRVADVKQYLKGRSLHLITLTGEIDGKPPAGLNYWVSQRGHPAICVINRQADNPAMNHAVLVIGISRTGPLEAADTIHYLDPSSPKQVHSEDRATFQANWARGQHAMMIVVSPPRGD
ncbi:MAG TPA: hypothetical protein VLM89_00175 [Phycisphaerae bacterium]|nr:hypothetical protein [Phycisphaerae bacterium]